MRFIDSEIRESMSNEEKAKKLAECKNDQNIIILQKVEASKDSLIFGSLFDKNVDKTNLIYRIMEKGYGSRNLSYSNLKELYFIENE